jgi:ParB family chromosome partitioning protein
MNPPNLVETRNVPLIDIFIEDRLRPVNMVAVQSLMQSIEQIGLQAEIHLRRVKVKTPNEGEPKYKLRLMAGGHRVEAFHLLGMEEIPAKIWDCSADDAQLIEIDDNLAHAQLEPLDLAIFLMQRKDVYERMHPETKRGSVGNLASHGLLTDNLSVSSFVASTAEQMGQSERNVFRMISAATRLNPEHIKALRQAPKRVSHSDLQTIAKLTNSADQDAVCIALSEGTAKSATEAMSQRNAKPGDAIRSDADKKYMALADAFSRAPMAAKRRFAKEYGAELRSLMEDAPVEPVVLPAPSFSSKRLPE